MYNLGIDIGTNSVGWCVGDAKGQLLKYKGKNMWGVRLFDEAQSAKVCRINRSTRRRLQRRRTRILKLREIMQPMIENVDKEFYKRLDESFYYRKDKSVQAKNIIFADDNYNDIDYYRDNKTIYHLRQKLLYNKEKADPREIYMALHHMLKYRGNFLYSGQKFDAIDEVKTVLYDAIDMLKECNGDKKLINIYDEELIISIEEELKRKEKTQQIKEAIVNELAEKKWDLKYSKEFANAILGYKFNTTILFNDDSIHAEDGKALKISFSDSNFEQEEDNYKILLEERYTTVEMLKKIYSWFVLQKILRGKKYLSDAMVEKYRIHAEELRILKELFRKYATPSEYGDFFHKELMKNKDNYVPNYANYIKGTKRCGKTLQEAKKNLYDNINTILGDKAKEDNGYINIRKAMEEETFLSKQNEICNAYIPFQLNYIEMEMIIDNQKQYYPELEKNKELLLKILTSKIPYYVGPLNAYKGVRSFAWMNKKKGMENLPLYPWNVDEIVDIDATAERFITRMTRQCTYLPDEKVLPINSLIYQRFNVLQELSQITINNKKLSVKDRNKIIKDLFENKKSIDEEKLVKWLRNNIYANINDKSSYTIKGYQADKRFASNLGSYITFTKILGCIDSSNEEMIEEIIYWLTVFEDKSIVRRKITMKYGDRINEEQINKIIKLNYSGWGNLSAKFINGIKGEKNTTILQMLIEPDERFRTLPNMMQIINTDSKIKEIIENNRKKYDGTEKLLDVVNDIYTSPKNKRGIWQCMNIISEIIDIMLEKPNQIFIEFAREDGEKERTKTRENRLKYALKKLKEECVDEYNDKINKELNNNSKRLDEEKVYLYFMQNGKSLYTGNILDINKLEECEVDHIIPQSVVDDNSLDNKALVLKGENQEKMNRLVQQVEFKDSKFDTVTRNVFWEHLHSVGMISDKKLSNLQKQTIDDVLTRGFINRQLVETRQIVKTVANLIQDYYNNEVKVIEIKASLSTQIRKKYTKERVGENGYWERKTSGNMFFKNRELNDFHHAHDAYLATIIGIYIQSVYPNWRKEIDYSEYKKMYRNYYENNKNNKKAIFQAMLGKFEQKVIDEYTGELTWDGTKIVADINKIFCYRDYYISRKVEEGTGAFYKETIYKKGNSDKLIPLKKGLSTKKYGGYSGGEKAYCTLVKVIENDNKRFELVEIPINISKEISKGNITLEEYVTQKVNSKCIEILRRKIQKYQLIELENEGLYYLVSANEIVNAKQLILGGKNQRYNRLVAHLADGSFDRMEPDEYRQDITDFYNFLQEKIQNEYRGFSSTMKRIAETTAFDRLDEKGKAQFIMELLKLTKANSEYPCLKKTGIKGLSDRMGRKSGFSLGKKITFIDKSVTGMHERRTCYELEDDSNKKSRKDNI